MKIVRTISWNVVEHVTIRTLLERYKASNENIHCMHGLRYSPTIDGDLRDFNHSWGWIQSQNPNNKVYVVDHVESNVYLT